MNDWWKTFFDQDYLKIWEQVFAEEADAKQAEERSSMLDLNAGCRVSDAPCGWGRLSRQLALRGAMMLGVVALFVLLSSAAATAQARQAESPQTVDIPSGKLRLKAFLWKPAGHGPFPAVVFNHGRSNTAQLHSDKLSLIEAANVLGPVFVRHGYVFLYPFRRGEGPSADQGTFIGDLLQREETAQGREARNRLQLTLMTTDHLNDAMAALAYLKNLPEVDAKRIAVAGHSFGGQLTLLVAERDLTVRAAIAFSPAALAWEGSPELRTRLLTAVDNLRAPVLFLQTENDYSLAANKALAEELARHSAPFVKKIYPPVGKSLSDGHNFLYTNVGLWKKDVFQFLDENLKR